MTLVKSKDQKIRGILEASLLILASKGYESTTIADISKAANVSRGLLHYYFSDKEDLVSKVLANSSEAIVKSSLEGVKGNSPQEVVDNMIDSFVKNLKDHPDFFAFLFEMWCASRRNEKINKELIKCTDGVINSFKEALNRISERGIIKINTNQARSMAKVIISLSDGLAFQLMINNNEETKNQDLLLHVKRMLLALFNEK